MDSTLMESPPVGAKRHHRVMMPPLLMEPLPIGYKVSNILLKGRRRLKMEPLPIGEIIGEHLADTHPDIVAYGADYGQQITLENAKTGRGVFFKYGKLAAPRAAIGLILEYLEGARGPSERNTWASTTQFLHTKETNATEKATEMATDRYRTARR